MCLYTKQICPIKARKDIVCYKYVLNADSSYGSKYITPIMDMPIDIGKTYKAGCIQKYGPTVGKRCIKPYELFSIAEGYIHCYAFKVKETVVEKTKKREAIGHIIECIIQKGTLYYISYDKKQIAAKEIRTIKLIV